MATPAHRLVQDQNQNVLYKGVTPGGKTDVAKADKRGCLGGRKALNDISNSRKPSVHPSLKKDKNVISIEKGPISVKAKSTKATEKGKTIGRKALSDLTNSVKPPPKQVPKTGTKLNSVAEENVPSRVIIEEGFLHNHQECIAAQTKTVDMDYFLKSVGLKNDIPMHVPARGALPLSSKKPETNMKLLEMEEMPDHRVLPGYCSPACGSPQSPKAPYMCWEDDDLSDLMVIGSPKLM